MKLHSNDLTDNDIFLALQRAQDNGKVAGDIHFVVFHGAGSRSRKYAWEIQLGTFDKTSGPTKSRHFKNSGNRGAGDLYAATYDEWGWFIAELFDMDPDAIFGQYKGVLDYNRQTKNAFTALVAA